MAEAFGLVADANREDMPGAPAALLEMLELVGLGSVAAEKVVEGGAALTTKVGFEAGGQALSPEQVLLEERDEARAARDFGRADEIRDELAAMGWEVRDSADGAKLVPKA
jgi:cysteinyl-tRNA synthetase